MRQGREFGLTQRQIRWQAKSLSMSKRKYSHAFRRALEVFDPEFYLQVYPDVREALLSPLAHYAHAGVLEGRLIAPGTTLESILQGNVSPPASIRDIVTEEVASKYHGKNSPWYVTFTGSTGQLHDFQFDQRSLGVSQVQKMIDVAHLVTFDLWGTLLNRPDHGDRGKLAGAGVICESLILDETEVWEVHQIRVHVERELANAGRLDRGPGEYKIDDVWEQTIKRLGCTPQVHQIEQAIEAEVAFEVRHAWVNSSNWGLLNYAISKGRKVCIVSDTYFSSETIQRIFDRLKYVLPESVDVFCSSDFGESKRWGNLLERVQTSVGCPPKEHLHIGDSREADIEPIIRSGGTGLHFISQPNDTYSGKTLHSHFRVERLSSDLANWYRAIGSLEIGAELEFTSDKRPDRDSEVMRAAHESGNLLGIALGAFLQNRITEACNLGYPIINYVSREGILLARIHDEMRQAGIARDVGWRHLAVSRVSTFLPSIPQVTADNLRPIWAQYSDQSVAELLESLGLRLPMDEGDWQKRFGLNPYEARKGIANDPSVQAILEDPFISSAISRRHETQTTGLLTYLRAKGVMSTLNPGPIVDVGWRGSIQDNLSRVLNQSLSGWYLGLLPALHVGSLGSRSGFWFDSDDLIMHQESSSRIPILESLLTPRFAGVTGYTVEGEVLTGLLPEMGPLADGLLESLHNGICEAAVTTAFELDARHFSTEETKTLVRKALSCFFENPSLPIAALIAESVHDENFGALYERRGAEWTSQWPEGRSLLESRSL